jgi:hypothetical protein
VTPYQTHPAEQASTEIDSTTLPVLITKFGRAIGQEAEDNHRLPFDRQNAPGEHSAAAALPVETARAENPVREVRWA